MSKRLVSLASAVLAFAAAPSIAHADVEPDPQHTVSLTFSPIHLILPVFEAQAELRLDPQIGLAVIGGIGAVSVDTTDGSASALVFEVGAKFAWYAVGDFEEGMQLGLEVLYVGVSGDGEDELDDVKFVGSGIGISPFIGYNIVADVGFTFEAQVGPAFIIATASSSDGDSASEVGIGPMLNLNIGWSL